MLFVTRNATQVIIRFIIRDDADIPVANILFDSGLLDIAFRRPSDTSWQSVTLVTATAGTWTSSGFIHLGSGVYELGIPNNSIVADANIDWRVTYNNIVEYDTVSAFGVGDIATNLTILNAISDTVWTRDERGITEQVVTVGSAPVFQFSIPSGTVNVTSNTQLYVEETGIVLYFASDIDVTAIPLKVIFEENDKVDIQIFVDADLTKTPEGFTLNLPDALLVTERTIIWGIRHATTNRFFGRGSFSIVYAPTQDTP